MKNLNIIIWMTAFLLPGYVLGEERAFRITGKVTGKEEEWVCLVTWNEDHLDTLGKSMVTGGKFRIEGRIASPDVAVLTFSPKNKQGFFLLEPGYDYKVKEKLDGISVATRNELEHYVGQNRNTIFSAFILTNGLDKMKLNALEQCYDRLTTEERLMTPGQKVALRITALKNIEVKAIVPNFTLLSPEGKKVSLYEVRGKLKIIDFWASWCGPCRLENPNMVKLYQDFKDRGLAIISVSLDTDKEKWIEAIQKDGMLWVHVSSLEGWKSKVVKMYGVDAVPSIFVLDENNRILAKQLRGNDLREFVSEHLK